MSEMNQKIIDMILKNATVNEIATATGLSNKQLFVRLNMLKMKGYNFLTKYYSNGQIVYKLKRSIFSDVDGNSEKDIALITTPKQQKFEAVLISDLHLANINDSIESLNKVYDFCSSNGIHVIINGGDLLDGCFGFEKKVSDPEKQIEYLLQNYPYDKNIINFTVLGNHDISILNTTGQNIETILSSLRHDIVSLGYGIGKLKIKNDEIVVFHPDTPNIQNCNQVGDVRFALIGHSHKSKNIIQHRQTNIYIPSLSNMNIERTMMPPVPSFLKMSISFNQGIFWHVNLEQYICLDKIYKVNESVFVLGGEKSQTSSAIKYEEATLPVEKCVTEEKVKVITMDHSGLSQIEKFNKRYGL